MEDGVVAHYNTHAGYGFLRRTTSTSRRQEVDNVYFCIDDCDVRTPRPRVGERVQFAQRKGPNRPILTALRRTEFTPNNEDHHHHVANGQSLRACTTTTPTATSGRAETFRVEQYADVIRQLEGRMGTIFVPTGLMMLLQSGSRLDLQAFEGMDAETQRLALVMALRDAMDAATMQHLRMQGGMEM